MNGGNEDAKWGGYGEREQEQEEEEEEEEEIQEVVSPLVTIPPVVGSQFALPYPLELTVVKKKKAGGSVYNLGDFAFKDPRDTIIFLVSARTDTTRNKRVLLNSAGIPILSAHKKTLSFYNRWDAYRGESSKHEDALFCVKRSAYFQLKTSLHVFVASPKKESKPNFKVKGNYHERNCTISHGSRIVAEVKKKGTNTNLPLDKETFAIFVQPGIDHAFIVALIIIMDEIHHEQDHSTPPQVRDLSRVVTLDSWRSF